MKAYLEIRARVLPLLDKGLSPAQIARRLDLPRARVDQIITNILAVRERGRQLREANRVSPEVQQQVRDLYEQGKQQIAPGLIARKFHSSDIAARLGLSREVVEDILRRKRKYAGKEETS